MAGFFISIEGIDKSGKSTQAELLVDHLQKNGYEVVFTFEPGATEFGQKLRYLALNWNPKDGIDDRAEMFLFAADRAQHVSRVIRPALDADKVVISDRFFDSTLAYQGYGRALDLDDLLMVQALATGGLKPNLTVWVDVDLQTARDRGWGKGADRIEAEDEAWFQRVREGFSTLWQTEPGRFFRVDGVRAADDIFKDIQNVVAARMQAEQRAGEDV